jgi:hypothetical protein
VAEFHLDLSTEEIGVIVNFLGYGHLSAPVWFIGIEEGLGKMDSDDAIKNLKARGRFENPMDLLKAHLKLQEGGKPIDIETKPPSTQVWQWMAKIMRAYNGQKDWRNLTSAKEYIRFRLGRYDGETFLTELSPIPAGNASDKEWMKLFRKLDPELDGKIKQRKYELQRLLEENSPTLVICYGSKRADEFARLLDVKWESVCPGICASSDARHLLLPFLGNGQMSHAVVEQLLLRELL